MSTEHKYIFFLELLPIEQTPEFFTLSNLFAREGFRLVPVSMDELNHLLKEKNNFLLVLTLNMTSFRKFNLKRSKMISYALKNKKLSLFHLNSFGAIAEFQGSSMTKNYRSISPPIRFEDLVFQVTTFYHKKIRREEKWPGGRRARLPDVRG